MKKPSRFSIICPSAPGKTAKGIFRLTRAFVLLTLLASLTLLCSIPVLDEKLAAYHLAEGLFHAVFRVAAFGVAMGFVADMIAKQRE